MQYTIENEYLRLTVDTHGAEAVSVVNKATLPSGAAMRRSCSPIPAS